MTRSAFGKSGRLVTLPLGVSGCPPGLVHRALTRVAGVFGQWANVTPQQAAVQSSPSLQLRVLGLGLLKDGDVGIGVFPEREEILIGRLGLHGVALHRICAA